MIENISLFFTAVATIAAAVAAIYSYKISKDSLQFQKKFAKNQNLLTELNTVITKAKTLRTYLTNSLNISGEQFALIDPLFEEIKSELQHLDSSGVYEYHSDKVPASTGELVGQMGNGEDFLSITINKLQNKYNSVFE